MLTQIFRIMKSPFSASFICLFLTKSVDILKNVSNFSHAH